MNRRSFFKVVTGFVAGMVAVAIPKAKSKEKLLCYGQNGTLCQGCGRTRCSFNYPTLDELIKAKEANPLEGYYQFIWDDEYDLFTGKKIV